MGNPFLSGKTAQREAVTIARRNSYRDFCPLSWQATPAVGRSRTRL
jgi:hypothetical protein